MPLREARIGAAHHAILRRIEKYKELQCVFSIP
jgi:hypothetical protein